MKKASVYYIKDRHLEKLGRVLRKILPKVQSESWAVKLHMGEYGNLNYLRPPIAELAVSTLKDKGAEPFLFDTPTLYRNKRYYISDYYQTARKNGFHSRTVGCSIKITNQGVLVDGKKLKKIMVAKPIYEADGILVLSHFKGHPDAGFGGAIKNLGMGAVTRRTKSDLHTLSQPVIDYGKCTVCGTCVEICPWKDVEIKDGRVDFQYQECFGCGACIFNCPQKAIKPKVATLGDLLAEAAWGVLKGFKKNRVFYVNVLMDITHMCDCVGTGCLEEKGLVAPDVGILVSKDILAIEKASFDLANKAADGKVEGAHPVDTKRQIKAAKAYGLGKDAYDLVVT